MVTGPFSRIMEFSPWLLRLGTKNVLNCYKRRRRKSLRQLNTAEKLPHHRPALRTVPGSWGRGSVKVLFPEL